MNYHKMVKGLFLFMLLMVGQRMMAQLMPLREDLAALRKKMKGALAARFDKDQTYAEYQRGIYNRQAWKNSWVGAKLPDLYKQWGAPTKAFPDGEGGQVVVYEKVSNQSGGTYKPATITTATNGFGQTVVTGQTEAEDTRWSSRYIEVITFYVGKDNVIKSVDFKNDYSRN